MQKKIIALAVAGAAAGFASAPVLAQSNVTIYGVIDQAVSSTNGGKGSVTTLLNSGYTTERLGFKGSEDMGNGLKANFMLEMGPNSANGYYDSAATGQFFQRTSTIGLSGDSWGQVNFGRQYTPVFSVQASNDIFRVAGVGSIYSLTNTGVTRASNSIRYDSPSMSGFSIAAMYSFGDTGGGFASPADPKDLGRHAGLNLRYANGPLAIGFGHGNQKLTAVNGAGNVVDQKTNSLAGSYDFKVVAINAGWQTNKRDDNSVNNRVWNVGASVPIMGSDSVKVVYADYQNKLAGVTNGDAKLVSLGYVHPMSKRTTLYGTYAKMTNDNAAKLSLFGGAQATGTAGYDPQGFQVGLSHNF